MVDFQNFSPGTPTNIDDGSGYGIVQSLPNNLLGGLKDSAKIVNAKSNEWAMAIGYQSNISGLSPHAYTIGNNLEILNSSNSFAIGNYINISSPYSFAFGNYADIDSKSQFSFAIGGTANYNEGDVNNICHPTINSSRWSYNFGSGKIQHSDSAIWLGHQIDNTGTNLRETSWNIYNSTESIGLGSYHTISGGRTNIALGYEQHIKESSYSTGIGHNNEISNSISGLVIGHINTLHSNGSIIVGISNNIHNGKYSTAIGYNNTVSGNNSIAVGSNTNIIADNTFGISGDIYAGGSFYFKEATGNPISNNLYLHDISNTHVNLVIPCDSSNCNLSLNPPKNNLVKYSNNNIIQKTSSINLTNVVCALVGAVKELNQIVQGLSSEINTNIHNIHKDISSISGDVHDIQHYLTGNGIIKQINSGTLKPKNIYLGISSDLSSTNTLKDWKTLQKMSQWRQFL